jgi:energy-converting hydrogenase B subunit I
MMSKIVKTTAKIVFVFALLFGIYVILGGHLTPGGGFQGGAIVASAFALLIVAFGYNSLIKHKGKFTVLECLALLLFISLAFIGMKIVFFDNFLAQPTEFGSNSGKLLSGGVIPLMNIAVGLEVVAALTSIILLMSRASYKENIEEEKE